MIYTIVAAFCTDGNGKKYEVGEKWIQGEFQWQCKVEGLKVFSYAISKYC